MLPVEILPVQETIVLRARGSELLILPQHVVKLKGLVKPRDFSQYFRDEALVNRPARKLFEAWLRKDHTLWPRLYQTVHKEMDAKDGGGEKKSKAPVAEKKEIKETVISKPRPEAKAEAPKVEKKAEPKTEKKVEKKAEPKIEKKAEKKPEPTAQKKAEPKTEKKAAEKKVEAKPKAKAAAAGKKKG